MDSFQTLFDLVGALARRRYLLGERSFATLGLNHTEARLLSLLEQAGGSAAQDKLSNGLNIDRTNAGRAMKHLQDEGYVVRHKDAADKRAKVVLLTAKGRKTIIEIEKLRKKMAREFFTNLKEGDADSLIKLLRRTLDQHP